MENVNNPANEPQFLHALMCGIDVDKATDWISTDLRNLLTSAREKNLDLYNEIALDPSEQQRLDTWLIPQEFFHMDIESHIRSLARDQVDMERIEWELEQFRKRNLIPVLKTIYYLVHVMRKNRIVWGVGRGSSVSSLVLYLMGVHRIDPVKWNLDASEFFK